MQEIKRRELGHSYICQTSPSMKRISCCFLMFLGDNLISQSVEEVAEDTATTLTCQEECISEAKGTVIFIERSHSQILKNRLGKLKVHDNELSYVYYYQQYYNLRICDRQEVRHRLQTLEKQISKDSRGKIVSDPEKGCSRETLKQKP